MDQLSEENLEQVGALNEIARERGQSLAQMALTWALRDERVTSVIVGASSVAQLEENLGAAGHEGFTRDELTAIARRAAGSGINLWAASSEDGSGGEEVEPPPAVRKTRRAGAAGSRSSRARR
jgi:L-glyceraldehyde 3-phosphate reductase